MKQPKAIAIAEQCLWELGSGRGHVPLLRAMGTQLSVPGECFLTGWDDAGSGERVWKSLSADDVKMIGNKLGIDTIAQYAQLSGLGEKTGIDLPGEVKISNMKCNSCGGAINANDIKMQNNVPMVVCPWCAATFQISEEPKW